MICDLNHESHITHSIFANLSWALAEHDQGMIDWCRRGYEWRFDDVALLESLSAATGPVSASPFD